MSEKFASYDGRESAQKLLPEVGRVYQGLSFRKVSKMMGGKVFYSQVENPTTEIPKFILELPHDAIIDPKQPCAVRVVLYLNQYKKRPGELPRFLCELISPDSAEKNGK